MPWCRQYSQNVQNVHFADLARVVADTWQHLAPGERAPYEEAATQEAACHAAAKQAFADMQAQFQSLYVSATVTGACRQAVLKVDAVDVYLCRYMACCRSSGSG